MLGTRLSTTSTQPSFPLARPAGPAQGNFSTRVDRGEPASYFQTQDEAVFSDEALKRAGQDENAKPQAFAFFSKNQKSAEPGKDPKLLNGAQNQDGQDLADREHDGKSPAVEDEKQGTQAGQELSERDQNIVEKLKARDLEVRAHEQAHLAAAGGLANGAPVFEYQNGPDGKRYAVGGHVNVDVGPVPGDPAATIQKAEQIKRSALAPEDPSSQDQRIAANADQMKAEAQAELAKKRLNEGETQPENTVDIQENPIQEQDHAKQTSEKLARVKHSGNSDQDRSSPLSHAGAVSGKLDAPKAAHELGHISVPSNEASHHAAYRRVAAGSLSEPKLSFVA